MSSQHRLNDEFSGTPYHDDYSEHNIYRSVGDLDHAKNIRGIWGNISVNSVLRQSANRVVAELGKTIYRSVADLERDAIHHRCAYWEAQGKLTEPTNQDLRLMRASQSLESILDTEQHREVLYDQLKDRLRQTRSPETLLMLKLEVERYASMISDPYWRTRFTDLISD